MNELSANSDKVLVLGDDDRVVLPIVRSLGRQDIEVHLGWYPSSGPAAASRYVHRVHALPHYHRHDDTWIKQLRKLLDEQRFNLTLPATEHAVYALQTHRTAWEDAHKLYLLEDDAYAKVEDKLRTYEVARRLGIPCPRSHTCGGGEVPQEVLDSLGLPVIIKPVTSVYQGDTLTKSFVRKAESWPEARAYLRFLEQQGSSAVLQACFDGQGVGISLLADRGNVLVALQHVRLHETNGYGSTYRATVALDAELLDACRRFVAAVGYTGVGMFEFRVNRTTGTWILLEVNGRFWGSLPLAVAAGVDFPFYLYQMWAGGRPQPVQDYRIGVRSRSLTNDLRWYWRTVRRKSNRYLGVEEESLGWSINRVSRWSFLMSLVRAGLLVDRVDSLAWDDLRPTLREMAALVGPSARRFLKHRWTNPPGSAQDSGADQIARGQFGKKLKSQASAE